MMNTIASVKGVAVVAVVGAGMLAEVANDVPNAPAILQIITIGVAGWTLLEVIKQGKSIATFKQKVRDLPCEKCPKPVIEEED